MRALDDAEGLRAPERGAVDGIQSATAGAHGRRHRASGRSPTPVTEPASVAELREAIRETQRGRGPRSVTPGRRPRPRRLHPAASALPGRWCAAPRAPSRLALASRARTTSRTARPTAGPVTEPAQRARPTRRARRGEAIIASRAGAGPWRPYSVSSARRPLRSWTRRSTQRPGKPSARRMERGEQSVRRHRRKKRGRLPPDAVDCSCTSTRAHPLTADRRVPRVHRWHTFSITDDAIYVGRTGSRARRKEPDDLDEGTRGFRPRGISRNPEMETVGATTGADARADCSWLDAEREARQHRSGSGSYRRSEQPARAASRVPSHARLGAIGTSSWCASATRHADPSTCNDGGNARTAGRPQIVSHGRPGMAATVDGAGSLRAWPEIRAMRVAPGCDAARVELQSRSERDEARNGRAEGARTLARVRARHGRPPGQSAPSPPGTTRCVRRQHATGHVLQPSRSRTTLDPMREPLHCCSGRPRRPGRRRARAGEAGGARTGDRRGGAGRGC